MLVLMVLVRIVRKVFIFISVLLLISLFLCRCWGRIEYFIGLNSVEWVFMVNSVMNISGRLLKMKLVVLISMMFILVSFSVCISVFLLYFLLNCLFSVENRKNGRMNSSV